MTNEKTQNAEQLFSIVKMMWESDNNHEDMMSRQLVATLYEIFDIPPEGMTGKEKKLLKQINDLEAEIIRLESQAKKVHNAFMPMTMLATTLGKGNEIEALKSLAIFIQSLGDQNFSLVTQVMDSHKKVMDLRTGLVAGY